jgi:hypothetical protein
VEEIFKLPEPLLSFGVTVVETINVHVFSVPEIIAAQR